MARRRHSIRHRKRKNNRTRSKRGGEGTPLEEKPVSSYVPFYNTKTGKQNIQNAKFFNPTEVSKEYQTNPNILPNNDIPDISAEEVFSKPSGYYSKQAIDQRKRTTAVDDYNTLMDEYNKPNQQDGENVILDDECVDGMCNISGGRKSRRYRRKTKKTRKSHRRH